MLGRRGGLRLCLILLLLLSLLCAASVGIRYLLERNGVERLEWSGLGLSLAGLHLKQLHIVQRSSAGRLSVAGEKLQLGWSEFSLQPPFWQQLSIQRLSLAWQLSPSRATQAASSSAASSASIDFPQLASALSKLPSRIEIDSLEAIWPCADTYCRSSGSFKLKRKMADNIGLLLSLDHQSQRIDLSLELQALNDALTTNLAVIVNQQPQLGLSTTLQQTEAGLIWGGQLDTTELSQAALLQHWLESLTQRQTNQWLQAPGQASLQGKWQVLLPDSALSTETLLNASGALDLHGNLSEPWDIPGLGKLQGQLALTASSAGQQWLVQQLETDLLLSQPSGAWFEALPKELQSDSVHLRIESDAPQADLSAQMRSSSLPLRLSLALRGASQVELYGHVALANRQPWALQFSDTRMSLNSADLELAAWRGQALHGNLYLSGGLSFEGIELEFDKASKIQLAALQGEGVQAKQLEASLEGSLLSARWQGGALSSWQFSGPLRLASQRLQQASLKPQGWRWLGRIDASEQGVAALGKVDNDSGLQLDIDAHLDADHRLQLKATLNDLFFRAGNPLAATLQAWPELLDLSSGHLTASASLTLAVTSAAPSIKLSLSGEDLNGIYDRSELSGLDTQLQFALVQQRFVLDIQKLRLKQANPGLPIGPVQLAGRYTASLPRVSQGRLQLRLAQSSVMGGLVSIRPGQWDLSVDGQEFPVQIRGLELEQLFNLYPAEGLSGSGTLDGNLPLFWQAGGFAVQQGYIAARAPGGRLQFNSEKIRALGRANPAMKLVAQSLEDFNFTHLSSSVDYQHSGALLLTMHLEGQNPAIENGRAINFNINLEENIPKLLTSLQLSNRVNEIITRRVQQRLLQRNAAPKEP